MHAISGGFSRGPRQGESFMSVTFIPGGVLYLCVNRYRRVVVILPCEIEHDVAWDACFIHLGYFSSKGLTYARVLGSI